MGEVSAVGTAGDVTDEHIGIYTIDAVARFRTGAPVKHNYMADLDAHLKAAGAPRFSVFARESLRMLVTETAQGYTVQPWKRMYGGGAVPLDTELQSNASPEDVGRTVRQCFPYCV